MNQINVDAVRLDIHASQAGALLMSITAVSSIRWNDPLNEAGEWSCSIPSELYDPSHITIGKFVKLYDASNNPSTTSDDDLLFAGPVEEVDTGWNDATSASIRLSGATALGLLVDSEQDGIVAARAWETPDYTSLVNLKYTLNQQVPEFTDEDDATWANVDLDYNDEEGVDGNGYTHVSRILVAHETPFNKIRLYVRGLNEGGAWIYFPQPQTPRQLEVELIDGDGWAVYPVDSDTTQNPSLTDQPFSKAGFGEISWTPLALPAQSTDEASGAKGYVIRLRAVHPDHETMEEPEGGTGRWGANRMQVYIAVPDTAEFSSVITDLCDGFSLAAGSPTGSTNGTLWQFYAETPLGVLQELARRTGFNFVLQGADKIKWFEGYPLSTVLCYAQQSDPTSAPLGNAFYLSGRPRRVEGRRPLVTRVTAYGAGVDDGSRIDISKFDASDVTLPSGFVVAGGLVINQAAETAYGITRHKTLDFPQIAGIEGGAGTTRQLSAELVKAAVAWLQMNNANSEHWELAGYNLKAGTHPGMKITLANLELRDADGNLIQTINKQMVITEIQHSIEASGLRTYRLEVSNTGAFPPHDWRILTENARAERQTRAYPQSASRNGLVGAVAAGASAASVGASAQSASAVQDNLDLHIAETADAHGIPAQIDAKIATHGAIGSEHNIPGQIAAHAADEDAHHGRVHDLGGGDHTGQLPWNDLDKTGGDIADIPARSHSDLQNITPADHHNPATSGAGVAVSGGQQVSLSPGTLSSASTNSAPTGGAHTHAVTASAAPSTDELLKADGSGGIELDHLTVANDAAVYGQLRQAIDGTSYFRMMNVVTYRGGASEAGPYICIETDMTETTAAGDKFMLLARATFFIYSGSQGSTKPPIDVLLGFYNYLAGDKRSTSYETTSEEVTAVSLARNVSTGKLAIIVQLAETPAYLSGYVDVLNATTAVGSYFANWSISVKANTTDYSNIQAVPDKTTLRPAQLQSGTAGAAITWSATQTFNGLIDANGNLDVQGQTYLRDDLHLMGTADIDAEGDLNITADGDVTIDAGSGDILTPSQLSADNWVSGVTAWGITPAGAGDFRVLTADELRVKVFISELQRALAGEQIVGKSIAILAADFTPATAVDGTATLTVYDLPNAANAQVFEPGDYVGIKYVDTTGGGLTVGEAIGTVSSYTDLADGLQSWTFTTKVLLPVAVTIPLESVAIDYGVSGDGIWRVSAIDPAGAPHASVETWTTLPTNRTVQTRLGNLDGIAGQSGYGLFAGNPAGEFIRINESGLVVAGDGSGLTDIQGGQVVVTGGGDLNSALGDLANEDSALSQALAALSSRGEQLVINGDGSLGDNTNFSTMTFEGAETPDGIPGAFREAGYSVGRWSDAFMQINPNLAYRLSFIVKGDPAVGQKMYLGLAPYDIDENSIQPYHWTVRAGTETTLAQPYTPGDPYIYLTDGTNWDTSFGGYWYLRFGGYKDSLGHNYGPYGYSRHYMRPVTNNAQTWTVTGNTLEIVEALLEDPANPDDVGGTWPIGTPVCMCKPGSNYLYIAAFNIDTPSEWTEFAGIISGFNSDLSFSSPNDGFWPGTAYVKLLMLLNRNVGGGETLLGGIRFEVDKTTAREAVLAWAMENDLTLINGGTIATNTILADSIAANTITADEIAANTITAAEIAAETITADEIAANAITAEKVAVGVITAEKLAVGILSPNLILNPTFDVDASGWQLSGSAVRVTSQAHSGAGSLSLPPAVGVGVSKKMRVTPGQTYVLVFYAKAIVAYSDGFVVNANYQNSVTGDDYIATADADDADTLIADGALTTSWVQKRVVFTPPTGHEWLSIEVKNTQDWLTTIFVDTFELMPLLAGTVIKDGTIITQNLAATAIDGMTITGNLIDGATVQGSTIYGGENAGVYTVRIDLDGVEIATEQAPDAVWPVEPPVFTISDEYKLRFAGGMKLWGALLANIDSGSDTAINAIDISTGGLVIGSGLEVDGDWQNLSTFYNYMKGSGNGIVIDARWGAPGDDFYPFAVFVNGLVKLRVDSNRTETGVLVPRDVRLERAGLHLSGYSTVYGDMGDVVDGTMTGVGLGSEPSAPTKHFSQTNAWRLYMYNDQLRVVFNDGQRVTLARNDGGEQTPSLVNSWANYGGSWKGSHYWREGDTVHVGGFVTNATTVADNELVFTLPSGYRPSGDVMFAQISSVVSPVRIDVKANGEVRWKGGAQTSVNWLSLSGISFRAA